MANVSPVTNNSAVVPVPRWVLNKIPPNPFAPDVGPGSVYAVPATLAMEEPVVLPANFDELPPEEQERLKVWVRTQGIRLKPIKGIKIPLTRNTLEL